VRIISVILIAQQKYAVLFIIQGHPLKITFYLIKGLKTWFSFKKMKGPAGSGIKKTVPGYPNGFYNNLFCLPSD
jgi:hypothetical protein